MLGGGRWVVRDAFGTRWTFVLAARASADERARALRGAAARWAIDKMFAQPRDSDWDVLIDLADVPASDVRHYSHAALKARVGGRVGVAGLLLLSSVPPPVAAAAARRSGGMTATERRVVAAVMERDLVLARDGWHYRVVGVALATAASRKDDFEALRAGEARGLVLRLATLPSFTTVRRDALAEAAELLVDPVSASSGGLVLLRRPIRTPSDAATAEPALTPSTLRAAAKQDITLTFLEVGTGRPIVGAALKLVGPDGSETRVTTSLAGSVTLTALDPGVCVATSIIENATADASFRPGAPGPAPRSRGRGDVPPSLRAWLAEVDEYRVRSGDTTDSIARAAGVAWDDLARFNWDTTAPAVVQDCFRDRVGCTRKTADGTGYRFDDADDPGVILIPRPWTGSFAVGMTHTILVAPLRSLFISLENEAGIALPGASYQVALADGSVRQGRLGRAGIARLTAVPEGAFSVAYPDQTDLLARSLAASTRRAFDEQATGPLFYLLGQEQAVIDEATAIYQQCFNDLTGRGLAADIDQVVTDPDARPPLVFLCALAGLPIEGTGGVTVRNSAIAGEPRRG